MCENITFSGRVGRGSKEGGPRRVEKEKRKNEKCFVSVYDLLNIQRYLPDLFKVPGAYV